MADFRKETKQKARCGCLLTGYCQIQTQYFRYIFWPNFYQKSHFWKGNFLPVISSDRLGGAESFRELLVKPKWCKSIRGATKPPGGDNPWSLLFSFSCSITFNKLEINNQISVLICNLYSSYLLWPLLLRKSRKMNISQGIRSQNGFFQVTNSLVQNDFGLYKSFWSVTNCFGQTQFVLVRYKI